MNRIFEVLGENKKNIYLDAVHPGMHSFTFLTLTAPAVLPDPGVTVHSLA
jgi:hypothetical protein